MFELIFATNNEHKAAEMQAAIGAKIHIITLEEAGIVVEIPEPHPTLEANASEKSGFIFNLVAKNCFSEDTGLEVLALNNEPGVVSARYAEGEPQYKSNVDKLLNKLENICDRRARFRTVISLRIGTKEYFFEGICEGTIGTHPVGSMGFGYDPVFIPEGYDKTFAEMSMEEKGLLSHRKKAGAKMVMFLQELLAKEQQS